MNNRETIDRAVELAVKEAVGKEWKLDEVICHPSESTTCVVLEERSEDGLITIGWEPKNVKWVVPANECFDPNRARDIAARISFGLPDEFDGFYVQV